MTTVLESLNRGLHRAFSADERVYLLGEDLLDPYGGAFKAARGLSSAYPDRVLTTPISEAGITGLAAGMALRGLRPVVEIMFGDFLTLAADQLVNHIAKFRWMYNDQVHVPLVVRTPVGGRRGYGPTHSQSLEKLFLGVPGLRVAAPAPFGDPGSLLLDAILKDDEPVLFVENKLLYLLPVWTVEGLPDFTLDEIHPRPSGRVQALEAFPYPAYRLAIRGAPEAALTIAAYGYMAELARQAVLQLAYEAEIFAELIVLTGLSPFELSPVIDSARRTRRLLAVEEGTYSLGWGAEVAAQAAEALGPGLQAVSRLAAADLPTPASGPLEQSVMPQVADIVRLAKALAQDRGRTRS